MIFITFLIFLLSFFSTNILSKSKNIKKNYLKVLNYSQGKKLLRQALGQSGRTFYCNCPYLDKKITSHRSCGYKFNKFKRQSYQMQWEHVVPAQNFGRSFKEWRQGASTCYKKSKKNKLKFYKGRKCARKNKAFRKMEGDPYNLVPSVGSINAYRSNKRFAEIIAVTTTFGKCEMIVTKKHVMPPSSLKGDIARIYFYMNQTYPNKGIIGKSSRRLFQAWHHMDPISNNECQRYQKIKTIYKLENPILVKECALKKSSKI